MTELSPYFSPSHQLEQKIADAKASLPTRLAKRHAKARRFYRTGVCAIVISLGFLSLLLVTIFIKGAGAFWRYEINVPVTFDAAIIDPSGSGDFRKAMRDGLKTIMPDVKGRKQRRELYGLISNHGEYELKDRFAENLGWLGQTIDVYVPVSGDVEMLLKGKIDLNLDEGSRVISDQQAAWVTMLEDKGHIRKQFNWHFFTATDSREPESAGIFGAIMGSFLMIIVTIIIAFPIGVAAAIYLEEFAPRNRLSDLIEVNINNLAAVPSIVFGLLGLVIFLNTMGVPRSAPLAGGLVLALMTLPTIIIAARSSLSSVPPSIREAALGMGASRLQMVMHHVLPLALPGILTGTVIGVGRAIGETAPLLMIGMVAFVVTAPTSFTDAATALPVQIFIWADSPERGFEEKTAAAILVLLIFLILINLAAIIVRQKFSRRW